MVRGLALAETTPGPLIMVVQFVARMPSEGEPALPQPLRPMLATPGLGVRDQVGGVA
jgi:hypothetical protein